MNDKHDEQVEKIRCLSDFGVVMTLLGSGMIDNLSSLAMSFLLDMTSSSLYSHCGDLDR